MNFKINARKRSKRIQMRSSSPEKKAQAGTSEQKALARSWEKVISSCGPEKNAK